MKIVEKDFAKVIGNKQFRAILLYGSEQGMITLKTQDLLKGQEFIRLDMAEIAKKPEIFANHLSTRNLFSLSYRYILISANTESLNNNLAQLFTKIPQDIGVVIKAGELGLASSLRKYFEKADPKTHAIIPFYLKDSVQFRTYVTHLLKVHNLSLEANAFLLLIALLGNDSMLAKNEIDKLAIYLGDDKRKITESDILALISDNNEALFDQLQLKFFNKDLSGFFKELKLHRDNGESNVVLVRMLSRYASRLYLVKKQLDNKRILDDAIKILKPPLFFKTKNSFLQHLNNLSTKQLINILNKLLLLEITLKTNIIDSDSRSDRDLAGIIVGR